MVVPAILMIWNSQPKKCARLCWIFTENSFCIFVANSCISSFFPIMSISSTYIMIMHTPSSFSLNSMQGSAGLTLNPKSSFFTMFTNFLRTVLLLGTNLICLLLVGSSLLKMILAQFLPFQLVTS